MPRRRGIVSSIAKAVAAVDASARRADRDAARASRAREKHASRETRALARMKAQQEREEARGEAKAEHEENERLERDLRGLLLLAPRPVRDRAEHEKLLAPRPFDEAGLRAKEEAEVARRTEEAQARVARPAGPVVITWAVALVLAGLFGAGAFFLAAPAANAAMGLAALALVTLVLASIVAPRAAESAQKELRSLAALEARTAAEQELAQKRAVARAAHDKAETERLAATRRLLAGETPAVKAAVSAALAALALPVEASSSAYPLAPGLIQIDVNLPPLDDAVPSQRSTLLKDGKVSYRNRAKKDVQELYARVVAGTTLLAGAVALDAAPACEVVLVSTFSPAVDGKTGETAEKCFVSLVVEREPLARLKLDRADPLAALENFEVRFQATAQHVLRPVEAFTPQDLAEETAPEAPPPEPAPAAPATGSGRARRPAAPEKAEKAEKAEPEVPPGEDALRLAIACVRADGKVDVSELKVVDRIIDRLSPNNATKRRLSALQASLLADRIDIGPPAERLRRHVDPDGRRVLGQELVDIVLADGKLTDDERKLCERCLDELDVPRALLEESAARLAVPDKADREKRERLAAIGLPDDSNPAKTEIARALAAIRARSASPRVNALAEELRTLLAKQQEAAEKAGADLEGQAPPEKPAAPGEPQRKNDDLDAIFG